MNKEKLLNLIPCPSEETSYLVRRHWRFSSKVKEQEWDAFSAAAVQHGAGAVAGATRPRREVKCIRIRKEETVYIPDWHDCLENPVDSTRKLLELTNEFNKVVV